MKNTTTTTKARTAKIKKTTIALCFTSMLAMSGNATASEEVDVFSYFKSLIDMIMSSDTERCKNYPQCKFD